jgi:hypothetical protein
VLVFTVSLVQPELIMEGVILRDITSYSMILAKSNFPCNAIMRFCKTEMAAI